MENLRWSYWPLKGTASSGIGRTYDAIETYGLLSPDYRHIAPPKLLDLPRPTEGPATPLKYAAIFTTCGTLQTTELC